MTEQGDLSKITRRPRRLFHKHARQGKMSHWLQAGIFVFITLIWLWVMVSVRGRQTISEQILTSKLVAEYRAVGGYILSASRVASGRLKIHRSFRGTQSRRQVCQLFSCQVHPVENKFIFIKLWDWSGDMWKDFCWISLCGVLYAYSSEVLSDCPQRLRVYVRHPQFVRWDL